MSISTIYTYPIPKLADGTPATTQTAAPETSTIANIHDKYADVFGSASDATTEPITTYYGWLKKALGELDGILDELKNSQNVKFIDPTKLPQTFENLKSDAFYTAAQTINGQRIDQENCREGFLAYRHYLKTIVSSLERIYNYLGDGRKTLEALAQATDPDMAHALITQLEIDEDFIYEEFQSLWTHYKYNADTKQWDKVVDKEFVSQLEKNIETYKTYKKDENGCLLDSDGYRIIQSVNRNGGADNEWYVVSDDGKYLTSTSLAPYEGNSPGGYGSTPEGSYNDSDGYLRTSDHFYLGLVDPSEWKKLMQADGKYYRLDSDGKLTMEESMPMSIPALQPLRDTKIACKDSSKTGGIDYKPLTVFNSITLLDRLKYIRWYYKLILQYRATDYSVFPNNSETGYPCLPNVQATKATEDTKSLGALETFYVGYLIDRDGPINAVSSFFEVKTSALRNNLSLQSQKISALNIYLDFINRGMDLLNTSQNEGKQRIPCSSVFALAYLCGQEMYNLFEYDGKKYLVIPSIQFYRGDERERRYLLVRADESGKNFLLGDQVMVYHKGSNQYYGNGYFWKEFGFEANSSGDLYCTAETKDEPVEDAWVKNPVLGLYSDKKDETSHFYNRCVEEVEGFKLPTQIECTDVKPSTVYLHTDYHKSNLDDDKHTSMVKSWTDAFSKKTQYINTTIDTINTDVSVDRSKIDTLDSLTSTFRSRAQDVYLNTIANVRG